MRKVLSLLLALVLVLGLSAPAFAAQPTTANPFPTRLSIATKLVAVEKAKITIATEKLKEELKKVGILNGPEFAQNKKNRFLIEYDEGNARLTEIVAKKDEFLIWEALGVRTKTEFKSRTKKNTFYVPRDDGEIRGVKGKLGTLTSKVKKTKKFIKNVGLSGRVFTRKVGKTLWFRQGQPYPVYGDDDGGFDGEFDFDYGMPDDYFNYD